MAARQGLTLVQYIAIRGDLIDKWPLGAIIAQACHASSAALHTFREDASTQEYLGDIDRMHKVVLRVRWRKTKQKKKFKYYRVFYPQLDTEADLVSLSKNLEEDGKGYKLWVEQPENYPTCLATKPYPKIDIQQYFKKFKLLK